MRFEQNPPAEAGRRRRRFFGQSLLLGGYAALWRVARPFLRRHKRLRADFAERLAPEGWRPCDIWIQAASGGESFLAAGLVAELARFAAKAQHPLRILCTSCTAQGIQVLENMRDSAAFERSGAEAAVRVFPLDEPEIMRGALAAAAPQLVVLLETELWPGLMAACAEQGVPVLVVNGRMTEKSLSGYGLLTPFWRFAAPERVLAMSEADAARFAALFGKERVASMPNMKFDSVPRGALSFDAASPAARLLPKKGEVVLLASVREEEEALLLPVIEYLRQNAPESVLVVAPRHMERVFAWKERLPGAVLRSSLAGRSEAEKEGGGPAGQNGSSLAGEAAATAGTPHTATAGDVVIWDAFGELTELYARADAIFVGGSLAKLGGQNFLEPAGFGRRPVIGPHWKNFAWVGEEFFASGLGVRVDGAEELGPALLAALRCAPEREAVRERLEAYIATRRGGTKTAAKAVWDMLPPALTGDDAAPEHA